MTLRKFHDIIHIEDKTRTAERQKDYEVKIMMKYEFEALAGYKVSDEDYNKIIEPMYMAVELNKQDFVKCIDRKRFEVKTRTERQYINEIKKIANFLYENCGRKSYWEEKDQIEKLTRKMEKQFGYTVAILNEVKCGCTYPKELIFYTENGTEIKRISLIK